jgi:hypothetical protein
MNIISKINNRNISFKIPEKLVGISKTPIVRIINSSQPSSTFNSKDQVYARYDNINSCLDYSLTPIIINNQGINTITWFSDNTNIASVANGYVTHVNNGSCNITATMNNISVSINILNQTSELFKTIFLGYANNSLIKHIIDDMNSRVTAIPQKQINLFSSKNHDTSTYIRNINSLISNVNTTSISPWNSRHGGASGGTLISPRHMIYCKHANFYPIIGDTVRFVNESNQVITRTVTQVLTINQSPTPDMVIVVLNSDATIENGQPSGISFCKFLPIDWYRYLPSMYGLSRNTLPYIHHDQEQKSLIYLWNSITDLNDSQFRTSFPTDTNQLIFNEPLITGDSGNPQFIIVNNQMVLLSVQGNPNFIPYYMSEINNAMSVLGYQLDILNLSQFNIY